MCVFLCRGVSVYVCVCVCVSLSPSLNARFFVFHFLSYSYAVCGGSFGYSESDMESHRLRRNLRPGNKIIYVFIHMYLEMKFLIFLIFIVKIRAYTIISLFLLFFE